MGPHQIAVAALLQPVRFAAMLDGGPRAIARAALAVTFWVATGLAFVTLVLPLLVPMASRSLLLALVLPPTVALLVGGLSLMSASGAQTTSGHIAFWMLRTQVAVTPVFALLFGLGVAALVPALVMLTVGLVLGGVWLGGQQAVGLAVRPNCDEAAIARWLFAFGLLIVGAMLWLSASSLATTRALFALLALGGAAGLVRPLSYLWEGPWSLALATAARLGAPAARLLPLHPVSYDHLCVLPMPGLRPLLTHACAANLDQGAVWLVRVVSHPGQRRVAQRAVAHMVQRGELAHPLLFWLSTEPEGMGLLREMADQPRPQPLVAAYAAFMAVPSPDGWPAVIVEQRAVLEQAATLPGGAALRSLLETGAAVLRSSRWAEAHARLQGTLDPQGVEADLLWNSLLQLRTWVSEMLPLQASDRVVALQNLWNELRDLDGWPAELLAAMGEHLLFLLEIERRRGAWLV